MRRSPETGLISGWQRHELNSRGSGFCSAEVPGILKRTCRVVLLQVGAINFVSQSLALYALRVHCDFVICYLDAPTRFLEKRSVPTVRLRAPRSNEDAVSHNYNPDPDKTVAAGASPNTQTLACPENSQRVIGKRSNRFLRPRSRSSPRPWYLADSRISGDDELAGAHCSLLEIRCIGRYDLPARYFLPQYLNGSHVRELAAQTLMVLCGGGEPDTVVCRVLALVAEHEDNLVLNVDSEATKHAASPGRQGSNRVEHELVRCDLALLGGEQGAICQLRCCAATRFRHRT